MNRMRNISGEIHQGVAFNIMSDLISNAACRVWLEMLTTPQRDVRRSVALNISSNVFM